MNDDSTARAIANGEEKFTRYGRLSPVSDRMLVTSADPSAMLSYANDDLDSPAAIRRFIADGVDEVKILVECEDRKAAHQREHLLRGCLLVFIAQGRIAGDDASAAAREVLSLE